MLHGFDLQGHYGDGPNAYLYAAGNSLRIRDTLGLYSEDNEIDDLIGEIVGHRVYAIGTIQTGAEIVSIGLDASLEIAGSLLGLDVLESAAALGGGNGDFWDVIEVASATIPFAGPLRAVAKASKFRRAAKGASSASRLSAKFNSWLRKGPKNVNVYIGTRNGKAVYVGVSNDTARRAAEHGESFVLQSITNTPLTRNEARALEQLIIENNSQFENLRNSISPLRDIYDDALNWARDFASTSGIPVRY
jgi:hypothetical protein